MGRMTKVDMSPAAIAARLKRAGGLSDIERRALLIRNLVAEVRSDDKASVNPRKEKKVKHARVRS